MPEVTSGDGTTIAYRRSGDGPVIVFVGGAFDDGTTCAPLADALRHRHTVVTFDRRGRGSSTDALSRAEFAAYTVEREIADLDAVLDAVLPVDGGSACVFGFSSGAMLALHAAAAGSAIGRLVLYEPPFALGELARRPPAGLPARLAELVAAGRDGDAVATLQIEGIGLAPELVEQFRRSPRWGHLEAMAQTVVYDATLTAAPNLPTPAMAGLGVLVLVLAGGESWPALRGAAAAPPERLANARYVEVEGGADHTIPTASTAGAIRDFLDRTDQFPRPGG